MRAHAPSRSLSHGRNGAMAPGGVSVDPAGFSSLGLSLSGCHAGVDPALNDRQIVDGNAARVAGHARAAERHSPAVEACDQGRAEALCVGKGRGQVRAADGVASEA